MTNYEKYHFIYRRVISNGDYEIWEISNVNAQLAIIAIVVLL